jgi:hypothetical protein
MDHSRDLGKQKQKTSMLNTVYEMLVMTIPHREVRIAVFQEV